VNPRAVLDRSDRREVALVDTLGTLIVLSTIVAAVALIFAACILLRPGWRFAARNGVILFALIVDLLVSLSVFEPSILRTIGPLDDALHSAWRIFEARPRGLELARSARLRDRVRHGFRIQYPD
jgi:hypothetical protein